MDVKCLKMRNFAVSVGQVRYIYSYKKNKREGSGRYGLDSGFIGMMFVKGTVLILMVVYIFRKIDKTIKENEIFRNNIMASAILLAEMDKEKVN